MPESSPRPRSTERPSAASLIGAAVAFLGGVLLIGRLVDSLALVALPGRAQEMQGNTAIGFALAGLAVLTHDMGRRRASLLFGALAAGLGSLVLAEQVAGRSFALLDVLLMRGSFGMRMSPATAIGFAMVGGLVLVHHAPGTRFYFRRATSMALAGTIVSVGLVGLASGDRPGGIPSMARMDVSTALAFLGLGMAFFLMVGKLRGASLRRRIPAWMPWLVGGSVGVLVLGIWVGLTADEEAWRSLSGTRSREALVTHANTRLRDRLGGFTRLAEFVGRSDERHRRLALDVFLEDTPAAVGALVLDHDGGLLLAAGPEDAEGWARQLLARPEVASAVTRSAADETLAATAPAAGFDEDRRLGVCVPVRGDGAVARMVVALDTRRFLDDVLADGLDHGVQVWLSDGGVEFYRSGSHRSEVDDATTFEHVMAFGDRLWTLGGRSWISRIESSRGASHALILWIGVFLAFSIAFAVRKSEQLRQRATSLEDAKGTIEAHAASLAEANARLEERAESLRATEERLRRAAREKRRVLDSLSAFLIAVDGDGVVIEWNYVSSEIFGLRGSEVLGQRFADLPLSWDREVLADAVTECLIGGRRVVRECLRAGTRDVGRVVSFTINPTQDDGHRGFAIIGSDVTQRQMLEVQLHASQKLESVGTLAAGIAHEINTPMQFVGDNVRFVSQTIGPLSGLLRLAPELRAALLAGDPQRDDLADALEELLSDVDVPFVTEELPLALEETLEGIDRVTTIVRAMKDFSHPGSEGVAPADVNQAVLTTLSVARNEYKYVADVETDLGDLPPVECWIADLNQVFLNLLVNGTHAIRDKLGDDSAERGLLRVTTRQVDGGVELRFSDTGTGVPAQAQDKLFDQFFTTKVIGRGTGLGLSICRAVVVDKHGGTIDFETEPGEGTTFVIRLPLTQEAAQRADPDDALAVR